VISGVVSSGMGRNVVSFKPLFFCDKMSAVRTRHLYASPSRLFQDKKLLGGNKGLPGFNLFPTELLCRPLSVSIYSDDKYSCRSVRHSTVLYAPFSSPVSFSLIHNKYFGKRYIHSSPPWRREGESPSKPSSKVEETVNDLNEKIKSTQQGGVVVPTPKRPLYKRIQDEVLHY
jgi:hypothetical protein